ncbi:erythromycin esterase family protein [Deinococcus sp. MIMF12]|uniref:Erythromycin esterase family protein n=1 Tax=Deinococcus rhizophilus TaxID=3049544 RepID=A0ABT7JP16_9DEIO|nr:erythromycin esterase family protein [Deinococcus rhizophilus]MDL2345394.1 erythromycin esterase family protein [Deinococcus rhizophilus]
MLAWECGLATGRLLDAALRGEGDLEAALRAQRFWTWETREILDALTRLRAWNLSQPGERRVRFVGADVQEPYLGVADLIAAGHAHPALAGLTARGRVEAGSLEARELHEVLCEVEAAELDPERRSLARSARRYVDAYLLEAGHTRLGLRDRFMAETLLEEGLDPAGLTVFWAHNEHVAVNPSFHGSPAAGFVLRQQLGPAYLAVGMMMGQGIFRTRNHDVPGHPKPLADLPVGPPAAHHSEDLFAGRGDGLYGARDHPHPGPRRFLGGQYGTEWAQREPQVFELARPLSDFDLIAFQERTSAAQPLPATAPAPR